MTSAPQDLPTALHLADRLKEIPLRGFTDDRKLKGSEVDDPGYDLATKAVIP